MDRAEWLDRSLRVLSLHYRAPIEVNFAAMMTPSCWLQYRHEGNCVTIGLGDDLPLAVEASIHKLTDEQILAAEALLPERFRV